jgi:putative transposase
MRPSISARFLWSFSTSKKPPQFADTRFQILGIGDGDFRWHEEIYSNLLSAQSVVAAFVSKRRIKDRLDTRLPQAPLKRTIARMPNRLPRLHLVFKKYDPPLYFVTFNTYRRRKLLANARVHSCLIEFAKLREQPESGFGRYVIMPDHVHLFVRGGIDFALMQWTRMVKRRLSDAISTPLPHWQKEFFDHLIRRTESYSEKWEYLRQNPVHAGCVNDPDEWPWQGEIARLEAL